MEWNDLGLHLTKETALSGTLQVQVTGGGGLTPSNAVQMKIIPCTWKSSLTVTQKCKVSGGASIFVSVQVLKWPRRGPGGPLSSAGP